MRNHHSQSVPSSNLAWEKSRHFATPPKWRLRNDCKNSILITCHFPDLNSSSDWLRQSSLAAQPIRSTWSQIQASDTSSVCSYFSDVFSGHEEKQHSSMFVLRMWAQQIHRTDLRGAWEREEKEVATKSYWRGNGIVSPPWIWHARTFPEQPSGQTFPKERRVLCQCHILAQNTQIFWNSKISPHMCTRVQNLFSQECWLFRWF